ncbi:MAG: hypothetical protein KAW46_00960, partial [candidate division Zixibacteria bacterium]|nr:hypothetical protein [candidate division Zixibacteria bacterium]
EMGETYSGTMEIDLLPDDTGNLFVHLYYKDPDHVDEFGTVIRCSFVTTGDTVEYFEGFPRPKPEPPPKTQAQRRAESRTPEKLASVHGVRVLLVDSTQREIFKSVVGPLPENHRGRFYYLETTWGNMLQLKDSGINWTYIPPGEDPFPPKSPPPTKIDSVSDSVPKKSDPSAPQGSLGSPASEDGISIVNVDGEFGWGVISMNDSIRFHIRINNTSGANVKGITNGFKLYGLNGGVQWTTPVGEWDTTAGWGNYLDNTFVNYYSANGSGVDTIGFGAIVFFKPGMPPGFDADGWTISTTIDFAGNEGKYICIDSCWYPPQGDWKWSLTGAVTFIPDWAGPYCYQMQTNQVYVSGHAKYMKATPSDTLPTAMRGAKVKLWDIDYIPVISFDSLGCANVDETGYFDFGPVSNTDIGGSGGQDLFFDIYAENEAAYVTDQYDVRKFMTTGSSPVEDVPSGFFDTTITASQWQSGPFFVADCTLDGYQLWTDLRPDPADDPGGDLQVRLYPSNQPSSYNATLDILYVNSKNDPANWWPDTYEAGTIQHEYGHMISSTLDFCNDPTGYPPSHWVYGKFNPETAAIEGFAHWWSCLACNSTVMADYRSNFGDSTWFNLENGEYGENTNIQGSFNARDIDCEGSVAGIWWDIFDANHDDYSGLVDYNVTERPHHPDNVWDSLYDGVDNILAALLDESVLGHRPDNINEFWDIWVEPPSLGNDQKLANIFYEHGDSTKSCCRGIRGNVDGDPEETIDISDLVYLVDYMFTGGPEPPCWREGDVDGSNYGQSGPDDIDISDLVYLIDYMFTGGAGPPGCG